MSDFAALSLEFSELQKQLETARPEERPSILERMRGLLKQMDGVLREELGNLGKPKF